MLYYFREIYYFIIYYLFYKFSGAHNKPTSDSKYDPTIEHQNNIFFRLVRSFEEKECQKLDLKEMENMSLPELNGSSRLNQLYFQSYSANKTRPVVIRGLIKNTKSVREWSPQYFMDHYSETKLLNIKKGKKDGSDAYKSFNQKLDCALLTLGESIKNMLDCDAERLYINNVTKIFVDHPELIDDLELNRIKEVDNSINEKNWLKVNMFMGGRDTGSSLHCAVAGNFFFNIHGKKKWILIDPKYSRYLKSTPSKSFEFVISGDDMENPSEILRRIPKYEVILEPGDVLYNPPWWWHYVHNETDFTIGCAVRDHTVYRQSFKNNLFYMLMTKYPVRLNPVFLWLLEKIKGYKYILGCSMDSDKYVINNLTGHPIDDKQKKVD